MMKSVDMEAICENIKDFLNKLFQVKNVKLISKLIILIYLNDNLSQGFYSYFAFFWRIVLQCPNYALNQIFKGFFRNVEKNLKTELNHSLNEKE